MIDLISQPWPWYVAGPIIGLFVPALLLLGGKRFGISSNLRHLCAAVVPSKSEFFRYDWKRTGMWNLTFALGIFVGGILAATVFASPSDTIAISASTVAALEELGVRDFRGLVPSELISWSSLATVPGLVMIVGGGFLVGFGARYAGGCTSGHAITGLAELQLPSLIAAVGFFVGGLFVTHLVLPLLL